MFMDEGAATTAMARTHARSTRGERAVAADPAGHWRVLTHALGSRALRGVVAAESVPAATDGDLFAGHLADARCPQLRPGGDVVVVDHLSAHRRAVVGAPGTGRRCCTCPPYSPDLNSIKQVWARVKALLRSAQARAIDNLSEAIAWAAGRITRSDLLGCFTHCGYTPAT